MSENTLDSVTVDLRQNDFVDSAALTDGWTGCLLHGFGASANDLIGLGPELGVAPVWEFPHAPVPITFAGMTYGRAWFPRESEALQSALTGSYFRNLRKMEPPGLSEAAGEVRTLLDSRGVDWSRLVLGGFSQGAMVVAELLRQGATDPALPLPAAALLFSGALIAESWWKDSTSHTDRAAGVPVFQSHGRDDIVLPFAEGIALAESLGTAGFPVTFTEFGGGHGIPPEIVSGARRFLRDHPGIQGIQGIQDVRG